MMTRESFKQLPHLLQRHEVEAAGFGRQTIEKYVDAGVLTLVQPAGCGQARFQKRQLAQLLNWEDLLDASGFAEEPPAMSLKAVLRWTGWDDRTLAKIVRAGGLTLVKPPGSGAGKYLKSEVAALLGFKF